MTYFIGIDIAKFKHDCFIMDQDGTVIRNSFSFKNNKAGFDQLLSILNSLDPSHEKRILPRRSRAFLPGNQSYFDQEVLIHQNPSKNED